MIKKAQSRQNRQKGSKAKPKKRSAGAASTTTKTRTTRVGTKSKASAGKPIAKAAKPIHSKKATAKKKAPVKLRPVPARPKAKATVKKKAKKSSIGPVSAARLKKANAATKEATKGLPKMPVGKKSAADQLAEQQAANLKQSAKHRDHQAKLVAQVKGECEDVPVKRPNYISVYNRKKKLPLVPTEGLLQGACYLIQEGAYPRTACMDLGVTPLVWRKWIKLAEEDPDSTFALFFTCLSMADARDENDDLQLITRGAKHSAALQWKRERKTGARWGNKVTHNIGGVEGAPIAIKAEATLTINSGARILAMLNEAGAIGEEKTDATD